MGNKMKKTCIIALFAGLIISTAASAQEVNFGADIKNNYTFSDGFVVDNAPVVQPYLNLSSGNTSLGLWASVGLQSDQANELDVTLSHSWNVAEGKVTGTVGRYFLTNLEDISVVKVAFNLGAFDASASYNWWDHNPSGQSVEFGYSHNFSEQTNTRGFVYGETGYGFNDTIVVGAQLNHEIGSGFTATIRGSTPIYLDNKFGPDGRGTTWTFGLSKSF